MLPSTDLPVGIATENCLAWSADGELAVAAGEELFLLIPRPGAAEPWTEIHFPVNVFTYDEWPLQTRASFADMSIGEEQARVTITSLAWSPPGVAKHKRSVLAILTTNLLLSLWAPGGDPVDSERWQRVAIIDSMRVRSMAWIPANAFYAEPQMPLSTRKWGTPLLAVADDQNGIAFLTVSSPYTSASTSWDTQTIGHEIIQPPPKVNDRPSLLCNALNAKHFIDYIDLGNRNSAGQLRLIYRSSGILHASMLTVSVSPLQVTLSTADDHQPVMQGRHGLPPEAPPIMQVALQRHKKKYADSKQTTINDVVLRTWGVASLGSLIAVCITSHPAKMVEYQSIVASSSTILFGNSGYTDHSVVLFPWQTIKNYDVGEASQIIFSTIFDRRLLSSLLLTSFDLKILYAAICATLFHGMSDSQRLPCLNAAELALEILEKSSSTSLQQERKCIANQKEPEHADTGTRDHLIRQVIESSTAGETQLLDICSICGEGYVGLNGVQESFSEAFCAKGHPFGTSSTLVFGAPHLTCSL